MERTKNFYLNLKGYNITEEIFEKYKYQFFILINTTFKISNHPEAEEFQEIFESVRTDKPSVQNVAKFLMYEPVKILWNSNGSTEFPGYAQSSELKEFISELKFANGEMYTIKNIQTLKNHC